MQSAKDSFYVALCDRLTRLNPQRTVVLNGATRPAVIVAENELVTSTPPLECVFTMYWGSAQVCKTFASVQGGLTAIECSIVYGTSGSRADAIDRGRMLAALDSELMQACSPPFAEKQDYTTAEPTSLGTNVFWSTPRIEPSQKNAGAEQPSSVNKERIPLFHVAHVTVFFYPEVN